MPPVISQSVLQRCVLQFTPGHHPVLEGTGEGRAHRIQLPQDLPSNGQSFGSQLIPRQQRPLVAKHLLPLPAYHSLTDIWVSCCGFLLLPPGILAADWCLLGPRTCTERSRMGPREPVPSFQSKDCIPVTGPEAQQEDLGKGAAWVRRRRPGVSFQERSVTEIQGGARSAGTGSRNRAQAERKVRGGDRAESFFGRGPQGDPPKQWATKQGGL